MVEKPKNLQSTISDSRQVEFWDRAADNSGFHHPLNLPLFIRLVGRDEKVVELGCGWGRVLGELAAGGYRNLTGFDPSPKMIERGGREFPGLDLRLWPRGQVPLEDGCAAAVLLFAVLTSVPGDDAQRELIAKAARLLRPGGVLYVSDYFIQGDPRNKRRYEEWESVYSRYGVFELESGAVLRHQQRDWFFNLVDEFEQVALDEMELLTMNGNPARAFQYFGEKAG